MIFSYTGEGFIGGLRGADFGVISYSYNQSSVDEFVYFDFGSLGATPSASADYGGINQDTDVGAAAQADWGDIRQAPGRTRFPFGVVRLASSTTFKVKKTYVGTGQIFEFGGGRYIPLIPWIVTGTVSIRGAAAAAFGPAYYTEGLGTLQGAANAAFSTQYFGSGKLSSASFTGEAKVTVYPEDIHPTAITTITRTAATLSSGYNATYDGTVFETSGGTGTSSSNGFAVGPHVRFGAGPSAGTSSSTSRKVEYDLDLTGVEEITFKLVMGSGSNGGETPDNNEDLWLRFLDTGLSLNDASRKLLDHAETTYRTPGEKTVTVPVEARRANQRIRIYQLTWSGTTQYDHYGFIELSYEGAAGGTGDGDTRRTLFTINGSTDDARSRAYATSGSLFTLGTKYATKTFAWEGSGTLFSIAGLQERNVYSYNTSSTYLYEKEDYQSVASATTEPNLDYGRIIPHEDNDVFHPLDYGDLANVVTFSDYPFGTLRLKSETEIAFTPNYVAGGTLFAFSNAKTKGPQNHYGSGTFFVSGAAVTTFSLLAPSQGGTIGAFSGAAEASVVREDKTVLYEFNGFAADSVVFRDPVQGAEISIGSEASRIAFIPRFFGSTDVNIGGGLTTERSTFAEFSSGSLFSFIGKEERRTYHYNSSSIDLFTRPDYGYITNAATEEVDHGPLDIVYYPETGWISLQDARLDYQYISDVATIYPFGILPFTSDTKIAFLPNYVGSGTLRLSGEVYIFFPPVHEGEGSFSISGHAEERFVSDEVFQTLFEFNDSATDRTSVREISDVELEIFGSAEESFIGNPPEEQILFSFRSFGITSFIPRYNGLTHIDIDGGLVAERSTFSEVVEGNLFSFISKEERRTYHYNTSSNNIFETPDYGYVSQVATETADHGSLDIVYYPETGWISTPDARLDYESISRHSSDYAFGIFPLKGAAHTPRARDFIGFGNLFSIGVAEIFVPPKHQGSGTFSIVGTAEERFVSNEVFQTLFEFNDAAVDRTSVREIFDVHLEIFGSAEESFIGNPPEEQILFTTRGRAVSAFVPNFNGSGELTIDVEFVERATFSEVVEGNLFSFVGGDNRRVYSYNNSSIDFLTHPDLGSVASAPDSPAIPVAQYQEQDYGHLENVYYPETGWISRQDELIDWQFITDVATNYPFGLFRFRSDGTGVVPNVIYAWEGSGSLFTIGTAGIALPNKHSTTGEFTISGAAEERFVANPPDKQVLFDFTGEADLILGFAESGFGTLSVSGDVYVTFTADNVQSVSVLISGAGEDSFTPNFSGSGSIFSSGLLGESVTKVVPSRKALLPIGGIATLKSTVAEVVFGSIDISGSTEPEILTFNEVFFGTTTIFGQGSDRFNARYVGEGFISTLSGAAEAFTASPDDLQVLFDVTGFVDQRFTFAAPETTGSIFVGGIPQPPIRTFAESGFGRINLQSSAASAEVDVYTGSGIIFSSGFGGEAITIDLPAFTRAHLQLSGTAQERFIADPRDITTHLKLGGDIISSVAKLGFAESFTVHTTIFGQADPVHYVPDYQGQVHIFSRGIAGESVSRKLPAFQADLVISGLGSQRSTVAEEFFGSLFTFRGSSSPEILTFAEQPEVQIAISGNAAERFVPDYQGEARIGTFSGAAESITVNPVERELLFTVRGGYSSVKSTKSEVKDVNASLFSETVVPLITKSYFGSGTLHLSGESVARFTANEVGTGFISTLSGAAESVTINPSEDTALFEFSGIASIRSAVSEVKFVKTSIFNEPVRVYVIKDYVARGGTLDLSGDGLIKISLLHIGSGSVSTFSGAAESTTVVPGDLYSLFDVRGIAATRKISVYGYYGDDADPGTSGSLFAVGGAAESRAIVTTTEGIFNISGTAAEAFAVPFAGRGNLFGLVSKEERRTFAYHPEGGFTVSGEVEDAHVRDYTGSGSVFSLNSAEESLSRFVPATFTVFKVTGDAVIRITARIFGRGDLYAFGNAGESRTIPVTAGIFGEFFGVARRKVTRAESGSGSATISGSGAESFIKAPYSGSAHASLSGQAEHRVAVAQTGFASAKIRGQAKILTTQAFTTTVPVEISGDALINISPANPGSGTIFVFGKGEEIGPLGAYVSEGGIFKLDGIAATRYLAVTPSRTYGWII